jgi:hypothetical protein
LWFDGRRIVAHGIRRGALSGSPGIGNERRQLLIVRAQLLLSLGQFLARLSDKYFFPKK